MRFQSRRSTASRRSKESSGVILLVVLLVISILFVIIGQLSYSVSLDRALAENCLLDAQVRCDLKSAASVFLAVVSGGTSERSLSFDLPTGSVEMRWTNEAGKFNINTLQGDDAIEASRQLDRLFKVLEEQGEMTELGLSGRIADFVMGSERPLLSLGELTGVEGITEEVLYGESGQSGLHDFLTVYSDGALNLGEASDAIIECMDETIVNKRTLSLLKDKIADPDLKVPTYVRVIYERLQNGSSTDSEAYRALITLSGNKVSRKVEVAVRKVDDTFKIVLFNEMETPHESFDS